MTLAGDSLRLEAQIQKSGLGVPVFQPLRDDPERQRLDPGDGVGPSLAVTQSSGEIRHFRQPPAVVLAVEFDPERHGSLVECTRRLEPA